MIRNFDHLGSTLALSGVLPTVISNAVWHKAMSHISPVKKGVAVRFSAWHVTRMNCSTLASARRMPIRQGSRATNPESDQRCTYSHAVDHH